MTNGRWHEKMDLRWTNLLSWQNIWSSSQIAIGVEEKLANQENSKSSLHGGISRIFLFQTYGNHATELLTFGHKISKRHSRKGTFDFTEIINNVGLMQGTVCQIVRFISHFSLRLYYDFENVFTAWS